MRQPRINLNPKPIGKENNLAYYSEIFAIELIRSMSPLSEEVFMDIPKIACFLAKKLIKEIENENNDPIN